MIKSTGANQNDSDHDEFSSCLSIPCNIPNDPNCSLQWIYDESICAGVIWFKLTITKPLDNQWYAIGFNSNQRPMMVSFKPPK
jgi:hypothetical protein